VSDDALRRGMGLAAREFALRTRFSDAAAALAGLLKTNREPVRFSDSPLP
jgi:hypothetical protein